MNVQNEAKEIFQHILSSVNTTIENEVMSLSIKQLNDLIFEHETMKYKPSPIFSQMAEVAHEELLFREARLHRLHLADNNAGA